LVRDRASAISMIKKGALVDKTKNQGGARVLIGETEN
jgi:hypothetical protein